MSDRAGSRQAIQARLIESFRDVTHVSLGKQLPAIRYDNAAGLLPAMLQRIEPEVSHARGFRVAVDAEDAALFVEFVAQQVDQSCPDYRA